jgi:hypothetical protein
LESHKRLDKHRGSRLPRITRLTGYLVFDLIGNAKKRGDRLQSPTAEKFCSET